MAIKKSVIVMALYDIGRDEWNNFNLSYNTYLEWMRSTLSLDSYFVIYTEEKFYDKIVDRRRPYDSQFEKTKIIVTPLEELDCYKLYKNKLEQVMYSDEFIKKDHHKVPEMTKPLYNIIMFNKLNFLKNTKDNNYFDADLLIWADAGGLREDISNYENQIWPSPEKLEKLDSNKVTFFSHSPDFVINDVAFHVMSQVRHIQGTAFFVPSHMIDELTLEFNQTINECLNQNYIGSDEKIFDITYCKNKSKYSLIHCTWREYFDIFKIGENYKKKIFLDLGSYDCQGLLRFTSSILKTNKEWEIHAFEPNPLIKPVIHNLNVIIHNKAVWIEDGVSVFKQFGVDGMSQGGLLSQTKGDKEYNDYYSIVEVETIDFYKFIKKFKYNQEIYMHIDIEWSEYTVIDDLLRNGWPKNIKHIWIEWHGVDNNYLVTKSKFLIEQIKLCGCEVTSLN